MSQNLNSFELNESRVALIASFSDGSRDVAADGGETRDALARAASAR